MLKGESPRPESSASRLGWRTWTPAHASGAPKDQQLTGHRVLAVWPLYLHICCSPTWNAFFLPSLWKRMPSSETASQLPPLSVQASLTTSLTSQEELLSSSFAPFTHHPTYCSTYRVLLWFIFFLKILLQYMQKGSCFLVYISSSFNKYN